MKLALEKWEPDKAMGLRMLAHDLAMGLKAVYGLCELARQGDSLDGRHRAEPPKPEVAPFLVTSRWQPTWLGAIIRRE